MKRCKSGMNLQEKATVTKFSDNLRRLTPLEVQCQLFCGGRKCKYESSLTWKPHQMALNGIYSSWITDKILAIARPNTDQIKKHKLIEQFLKHKIKTIINLQQPKEHCYCGPALDESGFTYPPTLFMDNGIFFYNYGWKDYTVASLEFILDTVKVIAFAMNEGRTAIHCHAGLGRTGVLIACYLVFAYRISANAAIRYVRFKRPNSIQTRIQVLCVFRFAEFILPQFIVFAQNNSTSTNLEQYLQRQNLTLHGYEVRNLRYLPKIIHELCSRLLQLTRCEPVAKFHNESANFCQRPFWAYFLCMQNDPVASSPAPSCSVTSPGNHVTSSSPMTFDFPASQPHHRSQLAVDENLISTNLNQISNPNPLGNEPTTTAAAATSSSLSPSSSSQENLASGSIQIVCSSKQEQNGGEIINSSLSQTEIKVSYEEGRNRNEEGRKSEHVLVRSKSNIDESTILQAQELNGNSNGGTTKKDVRTLAKPTCEMPTSAREPEVANKKVHTKPFHLPPLDLGSAKRVNQLSSTSPLSLGNPSKEMETSSATDVCWNDEQLEESGLSLGVREQLEAMLPVLTLQDENVDVSVLDKLFNENAVLEAKTTKVSADGVARGFGKRPGEMTVDSRNSMIQVQDKLNGSADGWELLKTTDDVDLLIALLCSWLQGLKEPILSKKNMTVIFSLIKDPIAALQQLDRCKRVTIEYLTRFVVHLNPVSLADKQRLMVTLVGYLCRFPVVDNSSKSHDKELCTNIIEFSRNLLDEFLTEITQ